MLPLTEIPKFCTEGCDYTRARLAPRAAVPLQQGPCPR